jgi:hypothetical protein
LSKRFRDLLDGRTGGERALPDGEILPDFLAHSPDHFFEIPAFGAEYKQWSFGHRRGSEQQQNGQDEAA